MKIANGYYKIVKMDWANITLPLKEGSPVSKAGVVANSSSAIGLVPQTVKEVPLMPEMYILVGGDVELAEVNASYGSSLEAAAKGAMAGIRFWTADLTVDDSADSSPVVPVASNIADSEASTVTALKSDFNDLLDALKEAGLMEADPEEEVAES